jgi:hypothetical protein
MKTFISHKSFGDMLPDDLTHELLEKANGFNFIIAIRHTGTFENRVNGFL